MSARLFENPPLDLIKQRLTLDPDHNCLRWTRSIGRYVKAGDIARGSMAAGARTLYVAIGRRKIPAAQIAWFLHTGHWPKTPVATKNQNPFDLHPSNLTQTDFRHLSDTTAAKAMRKYRQKKRLKKAEDMQAVYPHIGYSEHLGKWKSFDPQEIAQELDLPRREHGPFHSFEAAHKAMSVLEDRMLSIMSQPPNLDDDEAYTVTAGPEGAALIDFEITFWLDDKTGFFYWRSPDARYATRADQPAERGRYLQLKGRRYPAHNVVWFMHYAQWPDRKAIIHKNRNPNDNRIANLDIRIRP